MVLSSRSPSLLVRARIASLSVLTISSCSPIRNKRRPSLETHLAANGDKYERTQGICASAMWRIFTRLSGRSSCTLPATFLESRFSTRLGARALVREHLLGVLAVREGYQRG